MAVQQGRNERWPGTYSVWYVEGQSDVRTQLTAVFSILLVNAPAGLHPSQDAID
jgi:hypothetical protein